MIEVTIHLKKWKGKVSNLVFVVDQQDNIDEEVRKYCAELRRQCKYNRRTVTGYSVAMWTIL